MKKIRFAIFLALFPACLFGGGPSAEVTAQVNAVEVGEDFITFALYGEARLFVSKTREERRLSMDGGNAKWVSLRFENRFLVIRRPVDPVPGFSRDWEDQKAKAFELKGKKAFFQLWGTKSTVENSMLDRIDAEGASFRGAVEGD
ncbi:MAG: hypothetical protein AAF065_00430 [Verrucomicrobiota bacterium]